MLCARRTPPCQQVQSEFLLPQLIAWWQCGDVPAQDCLLRLAFFKFALLGTISSFVIACKLDWTLGVSSSTLGRLSWDF